MEGAQAEFVKSQARYPGLFAGRGYGKTYANIIKTFAYVHNNHGARGMATIPTWDGLEKYYLPTWREIFGDVEGSVWIWREKKAQLLFPGFDATVFVRPASEPDSCRGPNLAFAAMDEIATENQYETFRILQAAIRQDGYPNQMWVTSTPSDVRPWIKALWVDKMNPTSQQMLANPEQYAVHHGATIDNYHLPEWQRTELQQEYENTRWGRQEYWGEFITVGGLAFSEFSRDVHVKEPPSGTEFVREVTGYDYGSTSPTALITIKQDRSNHLWVTDEFYQRNTTEQEWIEWAGERGLSQITSDPSLSQEECRRLSRMYSIRVRPAKSKRFDARYKFWASKLSVGPFGPGLFISPSCRNLINEIENLAFKQPKGREVHVDEWAAGVQDHAYDAGAYAGMEFETGGKWMPVKVNL